MTLEWVLSFPIPLRILFAAHPELLAPVLRIIHRVIASFLLKQTVLKRSTADTGAVSLEPMSVQMVIASENFHHTPRD